jgi:endonuclease/exonuclease/phosphatase family metal-dependent hydrolase
MAVSLRIASFNVENLFGRAKVFSFKNQVLGDKKLELIGNLHAELQKPVYDEPKIIGLYAQVKDYVSIREDRKKLWKGTGHTSIAAKGVNDWDGSLVYKTATFSDLTRDNTAKVIRDIDADVLCLVEVEDKPTLSAFNTQLLKSAYKYNLLIDAFDPRGIDVAVYSKYPIGNIRTHMYDSNSSGKIFSRDCLEVEIKLPDQRSLALLCNHLKSRGYGSAPTNDAKRELQARSIANILTKQYDLTRDLVAVAGDFNDTPQSNSLKPLLKLADLKDVLSLQFPADPEERWTYHYRTNEQIDFILVSKPLQGMFQKAGVLRKGICDLEKYSSGKEKPYASVTSGANAASDHGAVWADFKL